MYFVLVIPPPAPGDLGDTKSTIFRLNRLVILFSSNSPFAPTHRPHHQPPSRKSLSSRFSADVESFSVVFELFSSHDSNQPPSRKSLSSWFSVDFESCSSCFRVTTQTNPPPESRFQVGFRSISSGFRVATTRLENDSKRLETTRKRPKNDSKSTPWRGVGGAVVAHQGRGSMSGGEWAVAEKCYH